jgi:hypothetical protein
MRLFKASGLFLYKFAWMFCFVLMISSGCKGNTVAVTQQTTSGLPVLTDQPNMTSTTNETPSIPDRDHDGLPDEIEDRLIRKFAPVVRFHPNERYLPADVSWYLQRTRMRFEVNNGIDRQLIDKGNVTMTGLISKKDNGQFSGLSAFGSDFFLEQTDIDGGDKLDNYRLETRKGNSPSDWVVYAHVRPAGNHTGMYDIQFIFFYAYNGDLLVTPLETAHEADVEHITVRVEQDMNTINQVFYAAHDGAGRWYDRQTAGYPDGFQVTAAGRPVVYSAVNSHASYPKAGRVDRGIELPDDETGDGGLEWNCSLNAVNIGEKNFPHEGMQWVQYSGRWGEIGETGFTTGPYGPAYQAWWNEDPE